MKVSVYKKCTYWDKLKFYLFEKKQCERYCPNCKYYSICRNEIRGDCK